MDTEDTVDDPGAIIDRSNASDAEASAQDGVPVEELQDIRERVQMLRRTAMSELEDSDDKAPAARAKSLTEEFERMIDDTLSQHTNATETDDQNAPTA